MTAKEKKIVEFIKEKDTDGQGMPSEYYHLFAQFEGVIDADVDETDFENMLDDLCEKGYLEKIAGLNGNLYKVKLRRTIAKESSSAKGNFFANMENAYAEASDEKLYDAAEYEAKKIAQILFDSLENAGRTIIGLLLLGAHLGCADSNKFSKKRKKMADQVFSSLLKNPNMENFYTVIDKDISPSDYDLIESLQLISDEATMSLLKYIFCFAHIDGKLDNQVTEKLENLYGLLLLKSFFSQDDED